MKDGWGLATDGKVLFGTDGTSTLYHIDPQSLKGLVKRKLFFFLLGIFLILGGLGGFDVENLVSLLSHSSSVNHFSLIWS